MPILRTPKGTKITFSQARLSALLSLVYLEAMGDKATRHRGDIQKHCLRIWDTLELTFGKSELDEWPGSGIQREIETELKDSAPLEVHEAFISMKINEFQDPVAQKKHSDKPLGWNKFEAQPAKKHIPLLDAHNIDPVWAIVVRGKEGQGDAVVSTEELPTDEQTNADTEPTPADRSLASKLSERLGVAARLEAIQRKPLIAHQNISVRRSQWLSFWKNLPKKEIPWLLWERHILDMPPDQKNKNLTEWWGWWQDQIDHCLKKSPALYELRRAVLERRKRGDVTGHGWTDGTDLNPEKNFRLEHTPTGHTWYRRLAVEHLKHVFQEHFSHVEWDWTLIQKSIHPERDQLVDWRAWQHLDESGALQVLAQRHWSHGEKPSEGAKELPQWAWMRMALALSVYDNEPAMRTKNAVDLYHQISKMSLILSASAVREAGRADPNFFEDHAWDVPDQFGAIQKVIYSAAVDTTWTGTSASTWSTVRSKNAPVRSGRRKSTGVNDFLRTIDSHLKAQGRVGHDRPVTVMLHVWHLDVEEFIALRHENGQRLQPVLLVSDLFMQRVAENGAWHLFDPYVYPEAMNGTQGYIEAEQKIAERKKDNPTAHKTIPAEKLWKKILNQARLGSPFVTFADVDKPYSISSELPLLHGLDGVGAFPLEDNEGQNHEQAQQIQWPAMAININNMMSDQGEPLLEEWRETLTWAFWSAERMYEACGERISRQTIMVRPLCLGAVGFYEAINKAMMGTAQDESALSTWIYKISEALSTLTTVVDQVFCQKNGPAPIWNVEGLNLTPFHPQKCYDRLKEQRNGGLGIPALHEDMSELFDQISAHRFSVRTVWAPFHQAATWAGVSPGGFGTLFPIQWVIDEDRKWRLTPTSFLMSEINSNHSNIDYGSIFEYPEQPNKWPERVRRLCTPDMSEWKIRLKHASLVRPWIDQGVSLTLPAGLPVSQLSILMQQAWWMGLSNIRFEDPFQQPDLGGTEELEDDQE